MKKKSIEVSAAAKLNSRSECNAFIQILKTTSSKVFYVHKKKKVIELIPLA